MKDWTKEWFTGRELLSMSGDWDDRITFHDKVCPEKQILITAGPEKSLKSSTAIELALALTCPPRNWYGIEIIVPLKVLYIFFEGEPGELKNKQIRAMAKYPNANLENIIFKHFDELSLDESSGINELLSLFVTLPWQPDVIFLDPWANCLEEENFTKNAKKAIANIVGFSNRWVIVHHRSKPGMVSKTTGEMLRGSGVPAQKAHTIIGYFPNPSKEEEITMKFKSRGPRISPITIEVNENGVINVITPSWTPQTQEEKAQVAIWDLLTREIARMITPEKTVGDLESEIAANLGISERTVKKAWQKMANHGIIQIREQGKEKYLNISPMELEPDFPI